MTSPYTTSMCSQCKPICGSVNLELKEAPMTSLPKMDSDLVVAKPNVRNPNKLPEAAKLSWVEIQCLCVHLS